VHVRDWHFVTKEWFAKDARAVAGKPLTDMDVDLRYQDFLLQVELVQMDLHDVLSPVGPARRLPCRSRLQFVCHFPRVQQRVNNDVEPA
jgi:hypothetical protein